MTDLLKVRARADDEAGREAAPRQRLVLRAPTLPPFIVPIISRRSLSLCNTIFLIIQDKTN